MLGVAVSQHLLLLVWRSDIHVTLHNAVWRSVIGAVVCVCVCRL